MNLIFELINCGRPFSMKVDCFDTVGGIKQKIHKLHGIPASKQIFIFKGDVLPDELNISVSNIRHRDRIQLNIRPLSDLILATNHLFDDHVSSTDHQSTHDQIDVDVVPIDHVIAMGISPNTKLIQLQLPNSKSKTIFKMRKNDTVRSLKDQAYELGGSPVNKYIVFRVNGIELPDHLTIGELERSYGLNIEVIWQSKLVATTHQTNSVVATDHQKEAEAGSSSSSSKKILLRFKMPISNSSCVLEMEANDTIRRLKEQINAIKGYPVDPLIIYANGNHGIELLDHLTLRDCGLYDDSEIGVSVRPSSLAETSVSTDDETVLFVDDETGLFVDDETGLFVDRTGNFVDQTGNFVDQTGLFVVANPRSADYQNEAQGLSQSKEIMLNLKIPISKSSCCLKMDVNDTIGRLKEQIHDMESHPVDHLMVRANGVELLDHLTLHDCQLQDGSEIDINIRSSTPKPQLAIFISNAVIFIFRSS